MQRRQNHQTLYYRCVCITWLSSVIFLMALAEPQPCRLIIQQLTTRILDYPLSTKHVPSLMSASITVTLHYAVYERTENNGSSQHDALSFPLCPHGEHREYQGNYQGLSLPQSQLAHVICISIQGLDPPEDPADEGGSSEGPRRFNDDIFGLKMQTVEDPACCIFYKVIL